MRLFIFILCCSAMVASAAEPTTADPKKLPQLDGPSYRPGDKQYPSELAKAGVQGEVLVAVPLMEDGKAEIASLGVSSRSEQLDIIAVDLVNAAKLQVKEAPSKGWKSVMVSVGFYKDSVSTLKLKTCADFNADFAYYMATFPERKLEKMRIFEMLTGVLYFQLGGKPDKAAEVAKRTRQARQPTIDGCKTKPESMFLETWQNAVKDAV